MLGSCNIIKTQANTNSLVTFMNTNNNDNNYNWINKWKKKKQVDSAENTSAFENIDNE